MKKRIYIIISMVVMAAMMFTACSAGKAEAEANGTTDASEAVSVSEESTTEAASAESTTEATTAAAETTTVTTTKKSEPATKKPAAQTTTKKQQTAPNQTTTKAAPKQTTTQKPQTTVKNVTPQEVQKKANEYIKSKGVKLDSSLTPSNAGWNTIIYRTQDELNSGVGLNRCKSQIDFIINEIGADSLSLYCYYDGVTANGSHTFYILYMIEL